MISIKIVGRIYPTSTVITRKIEDLSLCWGLGVTTISQDFPTIYIANNTHEVKNYFKIQEYKKNRISK